MNTLVFIAIFLLSFELVSMQIHPVFNENEVLIPCVSDGDCRMDNPGSRCIGNVCICQKSDCTPKEMSMQVMKIGGKCRSSPDCLAENSFCNDDGKCDCSKGTVSAQNEKSCLLVATAAGDPCEEDLQCPFDIGAAHCANGLCTCKNNSQAVEGRCLPVKDLGDDCEADEECDRVEFSKCEKGKCTCISRYVRGSSGCLLIGQNVFSPCSENAQCSATLGMGAECRKDLCSCKELYQYKASAKKCVQDMLLGEVCSEHEDCHQPGEGPSRLECALGECKCNTFYYQEGDYCVSGSSVLAAVNVVVVLVTSSFYWLRGVQFFANFEY